MTPARRALPDWFVIARREFLERVRTKWFAIVTALGPLFMIGLLVVPILLAGLGNKSKIQIVDRTGKVGPAIAAVLDSPALGWEAKVVPPDTTEEVLLGRIRDKSINGFLTISADALDGGSALYQGDNATSQALVLTLREITNQALHAARVTELKLSDAQAKKLLAVTAFSTKHTTGEAATASGGATFLMGYLVMFILYMAIVLYAVNVMRSVVQEKTNRITEIMVAAAKPRALMLGKILGVGAVGLAQLTAWLVMALLMIAYRGPILGLFGLSGSFSLPPLAVSDGALILADFFLGYFFYAALYAAVGAMVSSDQEAQQAQLPVTMFLILTMLSMQLVANDPRGGAAEVLTLVPFSSPILLPMRWLLGGASALDAVLSLAILAASTWIVTALSARIYRIGILMYGKRPGLREIARWLRHP